jgi:hypothetical protein
MTTSVETGSKEPWLRLALAYARVVPSPKTHDDERV